MADSVSFSSSTTLAQMGASTPTKTEQISEQISDQITKLGFLNLSEIAFIVIRNLQDDFMHFLTSMGESQDSVSFHQKRLQTLFFEEFENEIEKYKNFPKWHNSKYHGDVFCFCIENCEHIDAQKQCSNIVSCLLFNQQSWYNALVNLKYELYGQKIDREGTFDWMFENNEEFNSIVTKFMKNFALENWLTEESQFYMEKLNHIKQFLQEKFDKFISEQESDHYNFCNDDYYFNSTKYERCSECAYYRKRCWIDFFTEYINADYSRFRSVDDFEDDYQHDDEMENSKQMRRDDFNKNTTNKLKDKRRHLRNKGL